MSLINRYSTVDKALLVSIGNSLVQCGSDSALDANTSAMVKPDGTPTSDWKAAGSSALLNLPAGSTVLYAELIWYSTVAGSASGALDVRSVQDSAIVLQTPTGTSVPITPGDMQSYTAPSGSVNRFRTANVTAVISQYGAGSYAVVGVPTSIPSVGLSDTRAGWSLVIVYRNDILEPQRIGFESGVITTSSSMPYQATLTGFTTDSNASYLKGNLFMIAANGEPLSGSEAISVGPSFASLTTIGNSVKSPNTNPLTAPNNPYNNLFSGEINVCDPNSSSMGLLNINGTNGTANNDAFMPKQVIGARNKWDMTMIDISNTLVPGQNLLAGQLVTSGVSGVELLGMGSQVKALAPNMTVAFHGYDTQNDNKINIGVGEQLVYTLAVNNSGSMDATNVILKLNNSPYSTLVPNSVVVNSAVMAGADITNGINIGTVSANGVSNITFAVVVNSLPPYNSAEDAHTVNASVGYSYQFISGITTITNTATSNPLSIIAQEGLLSIVKSVNTNHASVGDVLNYSTVITNTGSNTAGDVYFQDKLWDACTFVSGSVTIDGNFDVDLDPTVGFSLPDLAVGASATIAFSVDVAALPMSKVVKNAATATFSILPNQSLNPIVQTLYSNFTSVKINYSELIGVRTTNNAYPLVGNTVTYTLTLTNIGNMPLTGAQILEPGISGASFVLRSVTIDGISDEAYNPFTGFTLSSTINPGTPAVITYQVVINQLQPNQTIDNTAQIPFKYMITPQEGMVSTEENSNTVETLANYVCMNISETVDKAYASLSETIYYTVTIQNNGNIPSFNIAFLSRIQSDTGFIPNTVAINGIVMNGYNPNVPFSVGTIYPNETVTVTYQVTVKDVPNPNYVYNQANLIYSYQPDPNGTPYTNTITSNQVQTIINQAAYTVTKSVDKVYSVLGDSLVYTTSIQNTGTVPLTNIRFVDNLPTFLTFYQESVFVNGEGYPTYNPTVGFNISTLHPGDSAVVVFGCSVSSIPTYGYILNTSLVTLSYQVNPNSPTISKTIPSNTVQSYIVNGSLAITKGVNKSYAAIGDSLTYSFSVSNVGNVPVANAKFVDNIPNGGAFVAGSVLVNGVSNTSYDPTQGFNLGAINVGQVVTVSFQASVVTLPSPNVMINNATASYSFTIDPQNPPQTETTTSNNVTTIINKSTAALTKSVDKSYATLNDILTYTITANNTGTVALNNVVLTDLVQTGAAFVANSVTINGTIITGLNPSNGINIGSIAEGNSTVVTFQSKVTSIPTPPSIPNTASMAYQYYINPTGTPESGAQTSNTVTTQINYYGVTNTKTVDKAYATVGDVLTFTSVIKNTGNVSVSNTNFVDLLSDKLSFVTGSVMIGSTSYPNYNPNTGFTIGTLSTGSSVTVTFEAAVVSYPANGVITNNSVVYYNYYINPNGAPISTYTNSTTATTYIMVGSLNFTKAANRQNAIIGDGINYTLVITNTGNVPIKALQLTDLIQSDSTLTSGSVIINGTPYSDYNPNTGFSLTDIAVGSYTTITFAVTVSDIPTGDHIIYNTGSLNYSYYIDPNEAPIVTTNYPSTTTEVSVEESIITATKTVDKTHGKINDTLTYTITMNNVGSATAKNVTFLDTLDTNLLFNAGTVTINGTSYPSYNPNTGFSVDDMSPNVPVTVVFTATIETKPVNNIVYNYAAINYEYKSGETVIPASIMTNITQTYVDLGQLTLSKSVNKAYATVGDSLTYTILMSNTGSLTASEIQFRDILQTDISFVSGSVAIDGVAYTGSSYNPNSGFAVPDLQLGETHTISFNATVMTVPSNGYVYNTATAGFTYYYTGSTTPQSGSATSNQTTTTVHLGLLTLTKSVDKMYATIGDTLNYSISILNQGNVTCTNNTFRDVLQADALFNSGTVMINGTKYSSYNPNSGFTLPDIAAGEAATVTFSCTIMTLPSNYLINNTASANYGFYIDPNASVVVKQAASNAVTTQINVGSLAVSKAVNKQYATIGDTVSYTVTITNTGNVLAGMVNFRDVYPTGLSLVTGSVQINGVGYPSYNPYQSFSIGNIPAGGSVVVKFSTTVTSLPTPSLVTNIANVTFSYYIDPNGSMHVYQIDSNAVTTQINVGSLTTTKAVDKMYATQGDTLTYSFTLANTGNVNLTGVNFTDNLQPDVTFNSSSVIVNGTPQPTYDPTVGILIPSIPTLGNVTLSFTATVNTATTNSSVVNYGTGVFSYLVDPGGQTLTNTSYSNSVYTIIITPSLTGTTTVDLLYATIGNVLNYTVVFKNTGNAEISQLLFTDTFTSGGTFVTGSVILDGVPQPNYNPVTGFALPDLIQGNTTKIEFQVNVTSVPNPPQINEYGTANGIYYIDPRGRSYPISATTNTVTTYINVGTLRITKAVDKLYASIGDTLTYTNTVLNSGNVAASDLFFLDDLQSEISFVPATLQINGVLYPTYDPAVGFSLANMAPSQYTTVTFEVVINALPVPPQVNNTSQTAFSYYINPNGNSYTNTVASNQVTTQIVKGQIAATKVVDKGIATIGDVLTYTVTLINVGNVIDNSVFFQDTPSAGATFNAGSVVVNGISHSAYDPTVGFNPGDIGIGQVVTIIFTATVVSVPSSNKVTNQATITFRFVVDPKQSPYSQTTYTNTVTTNIAYGNIDVAKAVDKQYATIGDTITYTVTVTNTGNINATNVQFLDPTPNNAVYKSGTVTVNGVSYPSYNPSAGFALNTLIPGQRVTVVYKVEVVDLC